MIFRPILVVGLALTGVACEQLFVVGVEPIDAGRAGGSAGGVAGGAAGGQVGGGTGSGATGGGVPSNGCLDGTREGFRNESDFPDIAACAGTWSGWIDERPAADLCSQGWRVCTGSDQAIKRLTMSQATAFLGCFAFDAANDCYVCHPRCRAAIGTSMNTAGGVCTIPPNNTDVDMAGVGANCRQEGVTANSSCLASGRTDATQNTYGCQADPMNTTGVTCCRGP
jgi:hypothetical protein